MSVLRLRWNTTVTVGAFTLVGLSLGRWPLSQAVGLIGLLLLLGSLASTRLRCNVGPVAQRLLTALALGLLLFLLVGAVVGAVGPHLGLHHPLSRGPLLVLWSAILVACAAPSLGGDRDPVAAVLEGLSLRRLGWVAVFMIPPVGALVAEALITDKAIISPSRIMGGVAVLLALAAFLMPTRATGPSRLTVLSSSLLTALWQVQFRGGWLSGWDIQHEYSVAATAVHEGVFPIVMPRGYNSDAYRSMLSLTVWPAQVHALTGLTLRTVLGLLPALALVATMVVVWLLANEWVGERLSTFLAVVFVAGFIPYIQVMPEVTRQCWAFLFFALVLLGMASRTFAGRRSWPFIVVALLGVTVTHYTTALLTIGMVLAGWTLMFIVSPAKRDHIVSTLAIAGAATVALVYELLIARTGSGIRAIISDFFTHHAGHGASSLHQSGGLLHRWIASAVADGLAPAKIFEHVDATTRATVYPWMHVDPRSAAVTLVNVVEPFGRGFFPARQLLVDLLGVHNQLPLLLAFLALVALLWRVRREPTVAVLTGATAFALFITLVSRLSQTFVTYFGSNRAPAQMNLVFVVAVAMASALVLRRGWRWVAWLRSQRLFMLAWGAAGAGTVALSLAFSTQLVTLLEPYAPLAAAYNTAGQALQQDPSPADLVAAAWIADHSPVHQIVQSDSYAQLALFNENFATRRNFFATIDPVVLANRAWVFANGTNTLLSTVYVTGNGQQGLFQFPRAYLLATRSVLYTSTSDLVFGSDHRPPHGSN